MIRLLLLLPLLSSLVVSNLAKAKEFTITDQDQIAIQEICETAARSPASPIELNAGIAQWCIQWKQRVRQANVPKPEPKPAESEK